MSLGASASLKLTHPSVPHMHHSWQQHVYEQYLFLFVCVCVMLRKSSSALFSCKLPLAQPQPQQRSRSSSQPQCQSFLGRPRSRFSTE